MTSGCHGRYRIPASPHASRSFDLFGPSTLANHDPIRRLELTLHGGSVLLQHGESLDGNVRIGVQAATDSDAAKILDSLEVASERSGDTLLVHVTLPDGMGLTDLDTSYHLHVPAAIEVAIQAASARIALRGFRGTSDVRTDSGEIVARLDGGDCRLTSATGAVRLEGQFGSAELHSRRGEVSVVLPDSRFPPAELEVETESAPIEIELGDACRAQLTLVATDGRLRSEAPLRWKVLGEDLGSNNRWIGEIGNAEAELTALVGLRTKTGQIRVRRLLARRAPTTRGASAPAGGAPVPVSGPPAAAAPWDDLGWIYRSSLHPGWIDPAPRTP